MGEAEDAIRRRQAEENETKHASEADEERHFARAIPGLVKEVLTLLKEKGFERGVLVAVCRPERRRKLFSEELYYVAEETAAWRVASLSEYSRHSEAYVPSSVWLLSDGTFAVDIKYAIYPPPVGYRSGRQEVSRGSGGATKKQIHAGLIDLRTRILAGGF